MFAHPFFEFIVASGILVVLTHAKSLMPRNIRTNVETKIVYPIAVFGLILTVDLVARDKQVSLQTAKITCYFLSMEIHTETIKKLLMFCSKTLNSARTTIETDFLYRGSSGWPFEVTYQLPSWEHYKYRFRKDKIGSPIVLGDHGLLLYSKDDKEQINLSGLNIVSKKELEEFEYVIYQSPFILRTVPIYSKFTPVEDSIRAGLISNEVKADGEQIKILMPISLDTHYKSPINFIQKLVLRNTSSGVMGSCEIEGSTLRQSGYFEQSPHLIKNPMVTITLQNGDNYQYSLFGESVYKNQGKRTKHEFGIQVKLSIWITICFGVAIY